MTGKGCDVDERDTLERPFEESRPHLRAVAYRMLGSLSEADDAVQEAWLRLSRSDRSEVENLKGWLTTVVARVCLDMLRSRRARPEEPVGPQVPEPIVGREGPIDPEQEALLADSVGLALLVVLDRLNPAERLAFVMHDMFALRCTEGGPRCPDLGQAGTQLRAGCPVHTSGARERGSGTGPGSTRTPVQGGHLQARAGEDPPDGCGRRSRTPPAARPGGPQRLTRATRSAI